MYGTPKARAPEPGAPERVHRRTDLPGDSQRSLHMVTMPRLTVSLLTAPTYHGRCSYGRCFLPSPYLPCPYLSWQVLVLLLLCVAVFYLLGMASGGAGA